jgi:hypothetical protein
LLIIDDYNRQGVGHLVMGLSKWLQLITQLTPAVSVRFAFCVPAAVAHAWPELVAAADGRPLVPTCNSLPGAFDPHAFISFAGLRDFRPTVEDFLAHRHGAGSATLLRTPSCDQLKAALTAMQRNATTHASASGHASSSVPKHVLLIKHAHLRAQPRLTQCSPHTLQSRFSN